MKRRLGVRKGLGRIAGGAFIVADLAAGRARCFKIRAHTTAHSAQCIQACGHGNLIQLHRKVCGPASPRQITGQADVSVAKRRVAHQILQSALGIVVNKSAVGVEIHGRSGANSARCTSVARSLVVTFAASGGAVQMHLAPSGRRASLHRSR